MLDTNCILRITVSITMTSQWARWRLKSPASGLFTQPFIQTQIKENIKALRHWPLWNSPVTGEFPAQMASNAENVPIWWLHHSKMASRSWKRYDELAVLLTFWTELKFLTKLCQAEPELVWCNIMKGYRLLLAGTQKLGPCDSHV